MSANDIWLIECNPMLYTVPKSFEADAGIAFKIRDKITRKKAPVAIL